jgi:hypothetical protein
VNTLKRYGVIWVSDITPITSPMKDGYWTPWHLAQERIAELEKFKTEHSPLLSYIAIECTTNLSEFKNWLAKRELEQQAKGIEDFVEPYATMGGSGQVVYDSGLNKAFTLRKQAKGGAE